MTQIPDADSVRFGLPDEPAARLEAIVPLIDDSTLDPQLRLRLGEEGYRLAADLGRAELVARCLNIQCLIRAELYGVTAAYELVVEASKAYEEGDETLEVAQTVATFGLLCVKLGKFAEARPHLQRSIDISRRLGSRSLESKVLGAYTMVYQYLGDYDQAIECSLQALAIEEERGNQKAMAGTLVVIGQLSYDLGDYERALQYLQRSLDFCRHTGDTVREAICLCLISNAHMKLGNGQQALATYLHALEAVNGKGQPLCEGSILAGLGQLYLEMGNLSDASDMLHRAFNMLERIGDQADLPSVLVSLSKLYLRQGEPGRAYDSLSRVKEMAEETGARPHLSEVHRLLSEYYEGEGDVARAFQHIKEHYRIQAEVAAAESATKLQRRQAKLEVERLEKASALTRQKAERMEHELELARNVQLSLLPGAPPQIPGLDIAAACTPALEVGGDFYDFFPLGDRSLGVAIGDVSGKGMPAAIHMTLVKGVLRSHALPGASPKDVLRSINHHLYETFTRGKFASMIYAVIDVEAMELRFASAGHNPLLLLRDGVRISPSRTAGMALGLTGNDKFAGTINEYSFALKPGDTIIFYTDGYSEAMNGAGEEYGEDALIESARGHSSLREADAILEAIGNDVDGFTGEVSQHDDMTAVGVRVKYEV